MILNGPHLFGQQQTPPIGKSFGNHLGCNAIQKQVQQQGRQGFANFDQNEGVAFLELLQQFRVSQWLNQFGIQTRRGRGQCVILSFQIVSQHGDAAIAFVHGSIVKGSAKLCYHFLDLCVEQVLVVFGKPKEFFSCQLNQGRILLVIFTIRRPIVFRCRLWARANPKT